MKRIGPGLPKLLFRAYLLTTFFVALSPVFSQNEIDENVLRDLRRLEPRTAVQHLDTMPEEEALRYAFNLGYAWEQEGNFSFALGYYELALEKAEETENHTMIGNSLFRIALIRNHNDRSDEAIDIMEASAQAFAKAGDSTAEAGVLYTLSNMQHRAGSLTRSLETLERVIAMESAIGDERLLGKVYLDAATVQYKISDFDTILQRLERAGDIFQKIHDVNNLGSVFRIYGNYYSEMKRPDDALEAYSTAADYYRQSNDYHNYANVSFNTSSIYSEKSDMAKAIQLAEEAVVYFTEAGSSGGAGMAEVRLGRFLLEQDRISEAEIISELSILHLESFGSSFRLAEAYELKADIFIARKNQEEAIHYYEKALELFKKSGVKAQINSVEWKIKTHS